MMRAAAGLKPGACFAIWWVIAAGKIRENAAPQKGCRDFAVRRDSYVRLSERSVRELRARADELRELARSASTANDRTALLRLADRFDELAEQRANDMSADQSVGSE